MNGETHCEMVTRTCGRAQIEDTEMAIRADAAEHTRVVRAKRRRIRAGMRGQRRDAGVCIWVPDFDCAVPRGREEGVFCDEVPVDGEDFARVLLPRGDGVRGHVDVEQLDGAVAAGGQELVLVRF